MKKIALPLCGRCHGLYYDCLFRQFIPLSLPFLPEPGCR